MLCRRFLVDPFYLDCLNSTTLTELWSGCKVFKPESAMANETGPAYKISKVGPKPDQLPVAGQEHAPLQTIRAFISLYTHKRLNMQKSARNAQEATTKQDFCTVHCMHIT